MLKKYRHGDKIKTIRVRKLSKETKLYKKSIGSLLGKKFGTFEVKSFHDVYGGKYRFLCKCIKCNKEVYVLGTRLKFRTARCIHCNMQRYGAKPKYNRVAPYTKRGSYKKKDIEMIYKEPKSSFPVLKVATIIVISFIVKGHFAKIFNTQARFSSLKHFDCSSFSIRIAFCL